MSAAEAPLPPTSAPRRSTEGPVNTRHQPDRSDYAKLAHAPLVLLVLIAFMRASVGIATPSASLLAVDLLALAMGALVAWLGGEFMLSREAPAERRRTRRQRPLGALPSQDALTHPVPRARRGAPSPGPHPAPLLHRMAPRRVA